MCDYPYNVDCQGTPHQNKVTTTVAPYSTKDDYTGQYVPWLRKIPARESCLRKMLMSVLTTSHHANY